MSAVGDARKRQQERAQAGAVDGLAAVLGEHVRQTYVDRPYVCSCEPGTSDSTRSFTSHLANALIAAGARIESGA